MPHHMGTYAGPSCWEKVKVGFFLGFCVGVVSATFFGGWNAFRCGQRGKELVSTVGKLGLQGGGTFGTFLAIGNGIRC